MSYSKNVTSFAIAAALVFGSIPVTSAQDASPNLRVADAFANMNNRVFKWTGANPLPQPESKPDRKIDVYCIPTGTGYEGTVTDNAMPHELFAKFWGGVEPGNDFPRSSFLVESGIADFSDEEALDAKEDYVMMFKSICADVTSEGAQYARGYKKDLLPKGRGTLEVITREDMARTLNPSPATLAAH